ncbi:MAG: hypothetical protein AB8H79_09010 [Myxococcota bacterium]
MPDTWSGGERLHIDSRGMSIQEPRVPGRGRRPDIEPLDVDLKGGRHRQLKDVVGDGLERDHWPSFAAIKLALERNLGRELSPRFERWLFQNTNTVAIDEALHKLRRSTGGRNSPDQISGDASDLRAAFDADAQDFKSIGLEMGMDLHEIEDAIDAMREVNEDLGVFMWVD